MIRLLIIKMPAKNKQKKWPNLAYVTIKCLGITSNQLNEIYYESGGLNQIPNNQLLEPSPVALRLQYILWAALFRTDSTYDSPSTTALTVDCLIQDGHWVQQPGLQSVQPVQTISFG